MTFANPPQPPPPPQQPPSAPPPPSPGLFNALFDVTFRTYATPHIARIVYILVMVVIGLGAIGGIATAFGLMGSRQPGAGFLLLILTPLGALIYLALARMAIELLVAVTRTADEVSHLRNELSRR
jgi:hypothetical protein